MRAMKYFTERLLYICTVRAASWINYLEVQLDRSANNNIVIKYICGTYIMLMPDGDTRDNFVFFLYRQSKRLDFVR